MKKPLSLILFALALVLCVYSCQKAAPTKIKALIVTGQNNHNWQVSHLAIQELLTASGRFEVDLAISPAQGQDMSLFLPDFDAYQVVVLDYNGDSWSPAMQDNFLRYVRAGGGVVIYHAADNAFRDWDEYNRICALGGWNDRNETDGPYVYWEDGQLVRNDEPGVGGSHGAQHVYTLNARNTDHPILKGLPTQWQHGPDELYDRMRGPGNIKELLYTAYSDPATGGSGREEPLVFTVDYGRARIFHIMLGHAGPSLDDNPAMQSEAFQGLMLRGCEWAGTK